MGELVNWETKGKKGNQTQNIPRHRPDKTEVEMTGDKPCRCERVLQGLSASYW